MLGRAVIELEQPAETLRALDRPDARGCTPVDQLVADALMTTLVVVVDQEFIDDSAQMGLAEQDHSGAVDLYFTAIAHLAFYMDTFSYQDVPFVFPKRLRGGVVSFCCGIDPTQLSI